MLRNLRLRLFIFCLRNEISVVFQSKMPYLVWRCWTLRLQMSPPCCHIRELRSSKLMFTGFLLLFLFLGFCKLVDLFLMLSKHSAIPLFVMLYINLKPAKKKENGFSIKSHSHGMDAAVPKGFLNSRIYSWNRWEIKEDVSKNESRYDSLPAVFQPISLGTTFN